MLWLLSDEATDIQVLKTELSAEPIRADSITLLQTGNCILHIEFQTLPASNPPLPLRMLDYWLRLHRKYRCDIEQVVIFLKSTTSEGVFTEEFSARNTRHRYRVIRLWEQDPAPLLANPALLPLATLARSNTPNSLLEQVAAQIDMIEEPQQRGNLAACVEVLAGLRFEESLIRQLLREEIMQESVTYQAIIQKGRQQGKQDEARSLVMRQLTRQFDNLDEELQQRIQALSVTQLEDLALALLDFQAVSDLVVWLDEHSF